VKAEVAETPNGQMVKWLNRQMVSIIMPFRFVTLTLDHIFSAP
jgi:hypothetical protein